MHAKPALDWEQALTRLGPAIGERAAAYDSSDGFVAENYAEMREAGLFSALVPEELGGGGLRYSEACRLIQGLGRHCGSTALTYSMHQHLVAAALLNHRHGKPGEKLLRMVAGGEKILVSTGATDWLSSNGTLQECEGGYRFNARKAFASGCLAGDVLVTSGQCDDPAAGRQVLHFALPMTADGVRIDKIWRTMGMRGTGSHTVVLDNVFVPSASISLRRPCGEYHPVWNVVLSVALPLICAAYVGVGEAAEAEALASAARKRDDSVTVLLMGELESELTTARIALDAMIGAVNELDAEPSLEMANRALICKTIVATSVKRVADKALEVSGGAGYFRACRIERILRDAEAAQFHPLPPKKQHLFSGRVALGLGPAGS